VKVDILDSRINIRFETIYKCPKCKLYHLLWRENKCKHCKQNLIWE
jgi:hypothetical protein